MIEPIRLLAFAFAGADLLFEIDRTGSILFATGAISGFSDKSDLEGRAAADLFMAGERARFGIIVRGLSPGDRVGPLPMTLASGEKATLAMCYLPQRDRIACTLVNPGKRSALGFGGVDAETGLADRAAFLDAAAKSAGGNGALALVNLPGLSEACANLSPDEAATLMASIGERVKTMGALVASRISDNGFGVVAEDPKIAGGLAERILSAIRERGLKYIQAEEVLLSLKGRNLTPEQSILALRHVIGRFAEGKLKCPAGSDLSSVFETVMTETLARAQAFHTTVADGAFELVFEPIVDLRSGATAYYEALTRFQPGVSPAETICFAEDLGMADSLDLAVAIKAFGHLERDPAVIAGVAINISGPSIAKPSSFAMLAGLLAKKRSLAKRIRIEITETSEIHDLAAADKCIQTLRQMSLLSRMITASRSTLFILFLSMSLFVWQKK